MVAPVRRALWSRFKPCLALPMGLAGATVLSLSAPSAEARTAQLPAIGSLSSVETEGSGSTVIISQNWGDFFGNLFRYVQVSTISDQEEVQLGQQINQMILRQQYRLYDNARIQNYVDQLGQQLVEASDSRDIPYTFQVVLSDEINAFAIPGGFVYVTTGLLQAVDNDAELASVLAHEIAHINERHSVEALRRTVLAQGIAETAGLEMNTLAQIGYELAVSLPRSRENEYEADALGIEILQAAGYPPEAFIRFLESLMDSGSQPQFLQTHPTSANRIEAIEAQLRASTD